MIFENRYDAAIQLIALLREYKDQDAIVMAIPRGGVPIGYHIARALHMPMELLLTKKIGHPLNKELAIGAMSIDDSVIDGTYKVNASYIDSETVRIRQDLKERYKKFMGERQPADLKDKVVIIVDDGAATGATILAAVQMIRHKAPKQVVVAVPVASREAAARIRQYADVLICPLIPGNLRAVSLFYHDFSEVTDEEVMELLQEM